MQILSIVWQQTHVTVSRKETRGAVTYLNAVVFLSPIPSPLTYRRSVTTVSTSSSIIISLCGIKFATIFQTCEVWPSKSWKHSQSRRGLIVYSLPPLALNPGKSVHQTATALHTLALPHTLTDATDRRRDVDHQKPSCLWMNGGADVCLFVYSIVGGTFVS